MAEFTFNCPQCGAPIEADDSIRGQVAECPYCGKGIVVPRSNMQAGIKQESDHKEITTKCPHCGTLYEVVESFLGQEVICEICGKNFVVTDVKPSAFDSGTDMSAQESVEEGAIRKECAKAIVHGKTLATIAKDKTVALWKSGTKGKVIISETILIVIGIVIGMLIPILRSNKSNSMTNIDRDATNQSVSRRGGMASSYRGTMEQGRLADKGEYKVDDYTWSYSISNGNVTIKSVAPKMGSIKIPSKIGKYYVTSISDWAFYGCSGLTSVTIPNSVTNIGDWAFTDCGGLKSLAIPNSVKSIGLVAFRGCTNLMSVTGGKGVMHISYGAFKDCCKLAKNDFIMVGSMLCDYVGSDKNITIPKGVTYIGGGAFEECKNLTSVIIPNSVTHIGDRAFSSCDGLTSITIPSSVTSIGEYAFAYCSGLTRVTLPNELTVIGEFAFDCCRKLTSITIPASVKNIGYGAFSGCSGLTQINVDKDNTAYTSVNGLLLSKDGRTLINGINGNGKVVIPNSVMNISNCAFNDCEGLTSVTIPASVTNIGSHAFFSCKGLTNVTIPEGVTTIGDWAFACCHLKRVEIPDSVASIGDKAFGYCIYLEDLSIPEAFADVIPSVFEKCVGLSELLAMGRRMSSYFGIDMRRVEVLKSGKTPEYYRKEAELGNARAQYYMGMCYFETGNIAEAAKWFSKAATQGHAGAQFELGYCFCYFIVSSEVDNQVMAMKWWRKAAAQGHKQAIFYLKDAIPADIRNGRRIIY